MEPVSQSNGLDALFAPRSVALVGATDKEHSVGRTILCNLKATSFGGRIFPVNPKRQEILGLKSFPDIRGIPEPVDLAVIATPAATVPEIIRQCVACRIPAAIIISAGFKECGAAGVELEQQVRQAACGKIRIVGPNCLGLMNPISGLNATFATTMARKGNVGFISQSGALCTAILDWSLRENVGFSAFISTGSMLDVGWGDLIYYLGDDPHTESIVIYMESVGDARSFVSAAREIALSKPIILMKAGRTEAAAKAAASHTGALAGSNDVLDAALRRCGVIGVRTIADMFYLAEALAKQPRPSGPRLAILTNAGGPAVLATDTLIESGGKLAALTPDSHEKLNKLLPPHWSHGNPVDVLGDADAARYCSAYDVLAAEPGCDGLLAIVTPQAMTNPSEFAKQIASAVRPAAKPVLASWMGGEVVDEAKAILNRASIPTFAYPDTAAEVFTYMWKYSANLDLLYETPGLAGDGNESGPDLDSVKAIIDGAASQNRTLLSEIEAKQLLKAYGLPVVPTVLAQTADEAVSHAASIGYPVVLKLHSHTVTHKTDVGGIQLNLKNAAEVRSAYDTIFRSVGEKAGAGNFLGASVQPMIKHDGFELILGSNVDPQFGPVLLFGMGGTLVEVIKDTALALPPLTNTLARQLMQRTRIYTALKGVRGRKPVDFGKLETVLVRFSQLIAEQRRIKEIDINPLLASSDQIIALDARVVLHDKSIPDDKIVRAALRPYPRNYVSNWKFEDGCEVLLRPIRAEDEPRMAHFHQTLSDQSVRLRYFYQIPLKERIAHRRLVRVCFTDYDREIAIVAEINAADGRQIIGVARLSKFHSENAARLNLLVGDRYQCKGLGREMLRKMLDIAAAEKLRRIAVVLQPDTRVMQHLLATTGFKLSEMGDHFVGELYLNGTT